MQQETEIQIAHTTRSLPLHGGFPFAGHGGLAGRCLVSVPLCALARVGGEVRGLLGSERHGSLVVRRDG